VVGLERRFVDSFESEKSQDRLLDGRGERNFEEDG